MSLEAAAEESRTPRFYFHLEFRGHLVRDRRGEELADRVATEARAFEIARALVQRRGEGLLDPEACVLKIADDRSTWRSIAVADVARAGAAIGDPSRTERRRDRHAQRRPRHKPGAGCKLRAG